MATKVQKTELQAENVCAACKHPVAIELQKHKTLGIFVPVWKPGPCRNPDCSLYSEPAQKQTDAGS